MARAHGETTFLSSASGEPSSTRKSIAGERLDCALSHEGGLLPVHEDRVIASEMSGSPTLATDWNAIGAVSTGTTTCSLVVRPRPRGGDERTRPGPWLTSQPRSTETHHPRGVLAQAIGRDRLNPAFKRRWRRSQRDQFGFRIRRRQADGGFVGFAPRSRQRPSPSRSTTPRLANRPSRIETALLSQWVAFAHWTTPASGWSRIASSSARSRAADSTLGMKPGCRLDRERAVPDRRGWVLTGPFAAIARSDRARDPASSRLYR
jgi:hypothetical protein